MRDWAGNAIARLSCVSDLQAYQPLFAVIAGRHEGAIWQGNSGGSRLSYDSRRNQPGALDTDQFQLRAACFDRCNSSIGVTPRYASSSGTTGRIAGRDAWHR